MSCTKTQILSKHCLPVAIKFLHCSGIIIIIINNNNNNNYNNNNNITFFHTHTHTVLHGTISAVHTMHQHIILGNTKGIYAYCFIVPKLNTSLSLPKFRIDKFVCVYLRNLFNRLKKIRILYSLYKFFMIFC